MKKTTAKFKSVCAETGAQIKKGEEMYYDSANKKCYCMNSQKAKQASEPDPAAGMIQANEEAYFDNFCQRNGI